MGGVPVARKISLAIFEIKYKIFGMSMKVRAFACAAMSVQDTRLQTLDYHSVELQGS